MTQAVKSASVFATKASADMETNADLPTESHTIAKDRKLKKAEIRQLSAPVDVAILSPGTTHTAAEHAKANLGSTASTATGRR